MIEIARAKGWGRGIELGLGSGQLFGRFLQEGIDMIGVDLGNRPDRKLNVEAMVARARRQHIAVTVLWQSTDAAHRLIPDGWADFIFIDAAHSYMAVKNDIANYRSKVREGGWLGGHDYHPAHPGVIRAVDEAFGERIEVLEGWIWRAL